MTTGQRTNSMLSPEVSLLQNSSERILLSAFGIHTGGGLVLLRALLSVLNGVLKAASLDERFVNNLDTVLPRAIIESVPPNFISRLASVSRLSSMAKRGDVLFCFNSLPPLRRSKGRVVIYVQAPHFVGAHRGIRYAKSVALRIAVERLWFRLGISNCDEIWVQTQSMADAVKHLYPRAIIQIIPLIDDELNSRLFVPEKEESQAGGDGSHFIFFYPADSVGHKNHVNLLRAWELLNAKGRRPKLLLTLSKDEWQALMRQAQLTHSIPANIENLGRLPRESVFTHLQSCSALIFPSKAETFGLPMLEARALGIPIIASERDFVRDVCLPTQTFDPNSPRSIAMAVDRHMGGNTLGSNDYYSARQFVEKILS